MEINNMNIKAIGWLILRIGIISISIVGPWVHSDSSAMPEWQASVLAPVAFSIAIFAWLWLVSRRKAAHFETPFSLTLPFFPMSLYPLRFFLLCAIAFISAGVSSVLVSICKHHQLSGSSIFLFIGIGIFVAVFGWMLWHKQKAES